MFFGATSSGGSNWVSLLFLPVFIAVAVGIVLVGRRRRAAPTGQYSVEHKALTLSGAKYFGGHPRMVAPEDGVTVQLWPGGFRVIVADQTVVSRGWAELASVEADGPTEIRRRVTATRVVTLGVLALAVQKKDRLSYLVVEDAAGSFIFEIRSHTAIELRAALQPFLRLPTAAVPSSDVPSIDSVARGGSIFPPPAASLDERLQKIDDLLSRGIINSSEHSAQRQRLLDSL